MGRTMPCTAVVAITMASVIIVVISISAGTIIRPDIIGFIAAVIVVTITRTISQRRLSQNS